MGVHHVGLTLHSSTPADTGTGIEAAVCRGGNLVVSKVGAAVVLRSILALEIDEDALGEDVDAELGAVMSETVVQAESIRAGSTIEVEGEDTES